MGINRVIEHAVIDHEAEIVAIRTSEAEAVDADRVEDAMRVMVVIVERGVAERQCDLNT